MDEIYRAWWWFRWQLSAACFWMWLKVTPEHPFKHDIVDGVASLGTKWRARLKAQEKQG